MNDRGGEEGRRVGHEKAQRGEASEALSNPRPRLRRANGHRAWPVPRVPAHGVKIKNGDWRYARDRKGRLVYGQVFDGINGQYQLVANGITVARVSAYECLRWDDGAPRKWVSARHERLQKELARANVAKNWKRVSELGNVLARESRSAA